MASYLQRAMHIQLDPGFLTKTSQIQLKYGIWVNLAQLGIGLAFGFAAVQVPQLSSPNSDISVTRSEASWIASVWTLVAPIGCMISGFVMDRFGRRVMLITCQGPMFVGWLYTSLAKTSKHIIIGRAITGVGCGMAMGPPRVYSTEISLPNMRGVIGAFPNLALAIGISLQAGFGQFFDWPALCYMCSVFTLVNGISYTWLPETPYFILKTKNEEQARANLAHFRGPNYDLEKEMRQLLDFKEDNDIRKLTIKEHVGALFSRSSCKPFSLILTFVFMAQISGVSCILMWSIEILMVANSSFDVHTGNFILALTRLVVGTITSILLFKIGRKPLALISAIGVSFTCLSIGLYLTYHDKPSLIPLIGLILYMAFASLGYHSLPFLMASELYPLQVRGLLGGITVSFTCFLIFGSTKVYPFMMDSLGLAYTMVVFGVCSLVGAIFVYFFLPETKDLTLQEIEEYYKAIRPSLVSQRRILSMQDTHSSTSSKSKISFDKGGGKTSSDRGGGKTSIDRGGDKTSFDKGGGKTSSDKGGGKKSSKGATDLINTGSALLKLEAQKRLAKSKTKLVDSDGTDRKESSSTEAKAEGKESPKNKETVTIMTPVENKESQGSKETTSVTESVKDEKSAKSQANEKIKQNEEKSSKINLLGETKELRTSKESVNTNKYEKRSEEHVGSIKKKDSKEANKDENQPSTSKKKK